VAASEIIYNISRHTREQGLPQNAFGKSGIYEILCHTCGLKYVGQTSRDLKTWFTEHCRYIKSNNPRSAYTLHILNNQHEFGPANNTVKLIQQCRKNNKLIH
jgi:hypothetical protein